MAECFGIVVLFGWIGLLQYLRVFKEFRYLAELIVSCLIYTKYFLVVLTIQILGFTSAYYWRNRLDITVE
jgi:hypothetical protein